MKGTSTISSITVGPRQTNIELLRIVAMFFVLILHANFWSLGTPTYHDVENSMVSTITRIIFESISIICVNVFVLISGWFMIKPSLKGFCNFIFQCLFFLTGTYLIMLLLKQTTLSFNGIAECLCLTKANWFIKAYIGLFILSPILNIFIEKSSKRQLGITILSIYAFQTLYGFVTNAAAYMVGGLSTFSFVGLYLLAQYTKRYISIDYRWGG